MLLEGVGQQRWGGELWGQHKMGGKAAPPAPPVLQPHKSEKLGAIDPLAAVGVQGDVPTPPPGGIGDGYRTR